MVKVEDCIKIGDKYYLATDVQAVFDARIKSVIPEDLE